MRTHFLGMASITTTPGREGVSGHGEGGETGVLDGMGLDVPPRRCICRATRAATHLCTSRQKCTSTCAVSRLGTMYAL